MGPQPGQCDMPCTLNLVPGTTSIEVSGDFDFKANIDVPAHAARVDFDRKSRGLFITGFVFLAISTVDVIYLTATQQSVNDISAEQATTNLEIALGGLAFAIVGSILVLSSGSDKATVKEVASSDGPGGIAFRGFGVNPTSKGASAVASWSF